MAAAKAKRPDWDFLVGDGARIPEGVGKVGLPLLFLRPADPHLFLEDGFHYLA